jgi:phage-related baseplate assembly protein
MNDGTSAGVTRIGWIAPPGDGTAEIIVAGADGPLSGDQLTAVQNYVTGDTVRGYLDSITITNAVAEPVTPNGDFYVSAGNNTLANRTRAVNALKARVAALAIGQKLDVGAIYAAIYAAQGVVDVTLSAPSGDTTVTARKVITIVTTNVADESKWHVA